MIETEDDIRRQPIKVRLEAEELMTKLENLCNFDHRLGQEWNDRVKYVFADIDERDEVNDANFHEAMATAQAFGINNTDSFYVTAYIALVYHKFSLYPNDVKLVKEFTIEGKEGNVLVQTLGQALTIGSKQLTHLRVFRDQWFDEPIDVKVNPKEVEDLINVIMMNSNWSSLRRMVPNHMQQQFRNNGKVVIGEMPPRMISIQAEQACAIIFPTVRTDMIVAHVATYAEFQVNSEELNSGRFLASFLKQQMFDAVNMVIPNDESRNLSDEKQLLTSIQSFDTVYGKTKTGYSYLETENTSNTKAYYMIAQDETINSQLMDALQNCDMYGRTLYFKMDQATFVVATIKLFDMLLPQKWTGNTTAIKKQLALILNWVKHADKSDKYYVDESSDASVEFNPSYPKVLIPGMPKEETWNQETVGVTDH